MPQSPGPSEPPDAAGPPAPDEDLPEGPEPSLIARMLAAQAAEMPRRRGPDEVPPFGRVDDVASVLGPRPADAVPGEGVLLWSDLADDPWPDVPWPDTPWPGRDPRPR